MKSELVILFFIVILPFVIATSTQMYGGETKIIGSYNSANLEKDCAQVFIIVNATELIHFTGENIREYSLENCGYHIAGSSVNENKYFDLWVCNCTDGGFDLVLSVLPNTINNYVFSLAFYNESILETENGNKNNDQTFTTTATITRGGGGGASTGGMKTCVTQWSCTEWSKCDNHVQTRACYYPEGWCEPEEPKPSEIRSCITNEESTNNSGENFLPAQKTPGFFSRMTGAAIGTLGEGGFAAASAFIMMGILGLILFFLKARREK